jgi:anti-anti-sigma regulatory factor
MYEVVQPNIVTHQGTLLESCVHQGVVIARVTTSAIRDRQASMLGEALSELVREHHGRLAIDCSNVRDFTCAWINQLLGLTRMCRERNWDCVVFGLKGPARDILRSTRLDRQMTLCSGRGEALAKLGIEQPSNWEALFAGEEPAIENNQRNAA